MINRIFLTRKKESDRLVTVLSGLNYIDDLQIHFNVSKFIFPSRLYQSSVRILSANE